MISTFSHEYRVKHNETDFWGRLTAPAFGDCMLDIAGLHAMEIGSGIDILQRQGLTWVISGMKLRFIDMPKLHGRFRMETHVSAFSRITTQRDFVAYDGDRKIAEASSEWLIINMETRRPVFVDEILPQLEEVCIPDGALPKYKHLRAFDGEVSIEMERKITYSDLDVNRHLYSMRYLQIALDTFDLDFFAKHRFTDIDLNFISEVLCGEVVTVIRRTNGDVHNIEMLRDGKAVFRSEFVTAEA